MRGRTPMSDKPDPAPGEEGSILTGRWKDDYGVLIAGYMLIIGLPAAIIIFTIKEWLF